MVYCIYCGRLAPAISGLEINDVQGTLTIKGGFASQGSNAVVMINGNSRAIQQWTDDSVVCTLEPDDYGDVYVETRGHRSNTVQITKLTGTIIQKTTLPPPLEINKVTETVNIIFRADFNQYRPKIDSTPEPHTALMSPTRKSTCSWDAEGWYYFDDGDSYQYYAPGTGTVSVAYDLSASNTTYFSFWGEAEMRDKSFDLWGVFCIPNGPQLVVVTPLWTQPTPVYMALNNAFVDYLCTPSQPNIIYRRSTNKFLTKFVLEDDWSASAVTLSTAPGGQITEFIMSKLAATGVPNPDGGR